MLGHSDRLRRRSDRNDGVTDHTDLRSNLAATAAISNSLWSLCGRYARSQMWERGFTQVMGNFLTHLVLDWNPTSYQMELNALVLGRHEVTIFNSWQQTVDGCPSFQSTGRLSFQSTGCPSFQSTSCPSFQLTGHLSFQSTGCPSFQPTGCPSFHPTCCPSFQSTGCPSFQ